MSKNRFSTFFAIVMIVIALGLIYLSNDEPVKSIKMEQTPDTEPLESGPSDEGSDIVKP